MPIEELHAKKRKTNLAILLVILGFCALVFGISIVKMKIQSTNKQTGTVVATDTLVQNNPAESPASP